MWRLRESNITMMQRMEDLLCDVEYVPVPS